MSPKTTVNMTLEYGLGCAVSESEHAGVAKSSQPGF